MKSYTDLEQSKKLAEILLIESADMCYIKDKPNIGFLYKEYKEFGDTILQDYYPAWSLSALLDILPSGKALIHDKWNLGYKCICNNMDTYFHNNPVDACVELIVKLKEENLL